MQKCKKLIIPIAFCAVICSFLCGRYSKEQEYTASRLQQCQTLISFAVEKVDNKDIADQGVMKALISNIYAAYELCDDPILADELHNLWNELIFESNDINSTNDAVYKKSENISEKLQSKTITVR